MSVQVTCLRHKMDCQGLWQIAHKSLQIHSFTYKPNAGGARVFSNLTDMPVLNLLLWILSMAMPFCKFNTLANYVNSEKPQWTAYTERDLHCGLACETECIYSATCPSLNSSRNIRKSLAWLCYGSQTACASDVRTICLQPSVILAWHHKLCLSNINILFSSL